MATIHNKTKDFIDPTKYVVELSGMSTETKPVKDYFKIGSLFLELDTGDIYYFNGSNWTKLAESGEGGGGGGSDVLIAHITEGESGIVCDKTYAEMEAATAEQKPILIWVMGAEIVGIAKKGNVGGTDVYIMCSDTFDASSGDTSIYAVHVSVYINANNEIGYASYTASIPATVN